MKLNELGYLLNYNQSKYYNHKTEVNGIVFDSKKEATYYKELLVIEKEHLIKDIKLQVPFILQNSFQKNGKNYRAITYIADFVYTDIKTGKMIVVDTKGYRTSEYKIKKKLFEYKYPNLTIKEV